MKEMRWFHTVYPDPVDIARNVKDAMRNYLPGQQREETWPGAANGPAGPEVTQAVREGDKFTLTIPEMSDSEPGNWGYFAYGAGKVTARVYQDGRLLKETTQLSLTTLPVSPDPATYRITVDTSHPAWFPLSTQNSNAWTFKSARPASGKESLALLWPEYGLDLDAENTTRAATPTNSTWRSRSRPAPLRTSTGSRWRCPPTTVPPGAPRG